MVSYLVGNAMTIAAGSVLGPTVVTGEFKIKFVRPAVGVTLVARATTLHAGNSQAVCRCHVFALDAATQARLCASTQGTATRRAPAG